MRPPSGFPSPSGGGRLVTVWGQRLQRLHTTEEGATLESSGVDQQASPFSSTGDAVCSSGANLVEL